MNNVEIVKYIYEKFKHGDAQLARQSFANVQCSVMWRQQNASGPLRITYS